MKRFLKRVAGVAAATCIALVALEALTLSGYRMFRGQPYASDRYAAEILARISAAQGRGPEADDAGRWMVGGYPEIIHPYLGFIPEPNDRRNGAAFDDPRRLPKRSEKSLVVGVFGGSFAGGVCHFAGAELRRVLALPGREVRIHCLAAGGYKQPQQLLLLAYLLGLGAQLDLVINIDGFNEVALPVVENVRSGIFPAYPRGWSWRVGSVTDPKTLTSLGALFELDRARERWARFFASWRLYHSSVLGLVWEGRDRAFESERQRIYGDLALHEKRRVSSHATTGPPIELTTDSEQYGYLAEIWMDSSLQMKRLCDANSIAYYHFLQPNQYVDVSKPMSPQERKLALKPEHFYRAGAVAGYPRLRQSGVRLADSGVRFHDLTAVFAGIEEPLYSDDCCHVNAKGYGVVARAIGDAIRAGTTRGQR
jgi:hypothetical protein